MNILFTCGGTAGHINPAVALARLFQERNPGCRILFVGADGGMETRLVPKEGYDIRTVTITNFQRSLTPAAVGHNLKTLCNMGRPRKQADAIHAFSLRPPPKEASTFRNSTAYAAAALLRAKRAVSSLPAQMR